MNEPGNPFWSFSLELYARPGVAQACLGLQDRRDLDVNLLLFCCWAGRQGRVLDAAELAALARAAGDWNREVVRPLRGARRWLKGRETPAGAAAEALRQDIKARELDAERLEQEILHATLPLAGGTPSPLAAIANLNGYFTYLERVPGIADTADLAVILTALFGEALRPLDALWHLQDRPAP